MKFMCRTTVKVGEAADVNRVAHPLRGEFLYCRRFINLLLLASTGDNCAIPNQFDGTATVIS